MKKLAVIIIGIGFLASCSGIPSQTWQPKSHPPVHKKYNKKK